MKVAELLKEMEGKGKEGKTTKEGKAGREERKEKG